MTLPALCIVALVIASMDWYAVYTNNQSMRYVAKPLAMVPLIGAASLSDTGDPAVKWLLVAALVFSLAGDVFLMLPQDMFVQGLGSFQVGHIFYIVALATFGVSTMWLIIGAVLVITMFLALGPTIIGGAGEKDTALGVAVFLYIAAISTMVAFASGVGGFAIVGALLFYVSDFFIGWTRFVKPFPHSGLAVIVTYHLAQIAFVLWLVT